MPKVGSQVSLTLKLGDENEFIRVRAEVTEIDTDLPIEPQLKAVRDTLKKTLNATEKVLNDKLEELINRNVLKSPAED